MPEITYSSAGVDVDEGQRAVQLMKKHVRSTFNKQVLDDLGGFGGLFALDLKGLQEPVLVSGTDGVGTKLKIAFMLDKHDTIGQDCVAMCVNDVLCQGAKPLFFLDYIATGKLSAEKVADIVKGIATACKEVGCALIGGETAEMPGFYSEGEYDVAGFVVGIADKTNIITGKSIEEGDVIIGLESSGLHSNGFSLVRKVLLELNEFSLDTHFNRLGSTLGEELIKPTKLYVKPVLEVIKSVNIKGIVHITGGGFYENIPRILPANVNAKIELQSWKVPEIFKLIQEQGNIDSGEMFKTFNMGIGMMLVVDKSNVKKTIDILNENGENAKEIGKIVKGSNKVLLCRS
ncbi:MAG: phosphoribosylformylglycinamidine cyclo-ligase [Alkaliphilus sp.]|nr:phosphoribosylformylglycinamidine cyclo-ligase [bacterium AH-315-L21]MBN4063034.1 phosphoribosylformylglycinamidine cyclo-ligase [Alkaliphilus sp. AH-315-G20]MBN4067596.1 phosphoribosylformylglycinamidine cyclo-ligase [Alkaliphilus transvaalensis]PHS33889.1 MAG: phosphoribosylformylglycinamidine cyclo-ligase [Alkaliphilus sp.]